MSKPTIRCVPLVRVWAAVILSLPMAASAQTQISFQPGPPLSLGEEPRYMSFADFDDDGVLDLAVASIGANEVSVLSSTPAGTLARRGQPIAFGRDLGQIVAQDFTEDGQADIAVLREYTGSRKAEVIIIPRTGSAAFGTPIAIPTTQRIATSLVATDFDRVNGPDFAVAHGRFESVAAYLNREDDNGFTVLPEVTIHKEPRLLVTGQMSRDNLPDLVVLNTNTSGQDEVVVLLTQTNVQGTTFVPGAQLSIAGEPVVAMIATDINLDGLADVLLLHEQIDRRFGITTLLNTTGAQPNAPLSFQTIAPRTFECPRLFGQDPSRCEPLDLAAADFDRDRHPDVAVSMTSPSTVVFLQGLGDGELIPTNYQIAIGTTPAELLVADVTGDRQVDLVVADPDDSTVTVLRNNLPVPQPNGESCTQGIECESASCVNGVCCGAALCPSGQRCDVPGKEGFCAAPAADGAMCSQNATCASTFCRDNVCCATASCPSGQRCDVPGSEGSCRVPPPTATQTATPTATRSGIATATPTSTATPTRTRRPNGATCGNDGSLCASSFCTNGVCCSEGRCGVGERCDITGESGNCTAQSSAGGACGKDTDCADGRRCELDHCSQTPGPTPEPQACVGDCGGDGEVTVDEILSLIDIALGQQPAANCINGDVNGDEQISVDEIVTAVRLALTGCAGEELPTPTPPSDTPTLSAPTATRTATPTLGEGTPTEEPTTPTVEPMTPTAEPATPTPQPTATAEATETPPGVDFRSFTDFRFDRFGTETFCPPLDSVYSARIRKQGEGYQLDLQLLVEGNPATDECLPDYTGPAACAVAQTLSEMPSLSAAEVSDLLALFSGVELLDAAEPNCTPDPCLVNVAQWDERETADYGCQTSNRLSAAQAQAIVSYLDALAQVRRTQ